jgi:hypothetical protein
LLASPLVVPPCSNSMPTLQCTEQRSNRIPLAGSTSSLVVQRRLGRISRPVTTTPPYPDAQLANGPQSWFTICF